MKLLKTFPFLVALTSTGALHGMDYFWNGSLNGNFSELSNWYLDPAFVMGATSLPGASDIIYLGTPSGSPPLSNELLSFGGNVALQGLHWEGYQEEVYSLGLAEELLTLGSAGLTLSDFTSELRLLSQIHLGADQIWTNGSFAELTLGSQVTMAGSLQLQGTSAFNFQNTLQVNGTRTLTVGEGSQAKLAGIVLSNSTLTLSTMGENPVEVTGVIAGQTNTANQHLEKNGAGTLILHEGFATTGNFRIRDGEVEMRKGNVQATQLLFGAASGTIGQDGYGILSLAKSDSQRVTYTLAANTYVHATSDGAWVRAVGEGEFDPTLLLSGERVFIIRPLNDYNEVRLQVDVGMANGTSNGALTKRGAATMMVSGVNTYTGSTNIDRGRLILDYGVHHGDIKLSNTAATTLRGGTLQLLGNASHATREYAGSMAVGVGVNTLELTSVQGQAMELVISGNLTRNNNTANVGTGVTTNNSNGILNLVTRDGALGRLGVEGASLQNNAAGFIGGWFIYNGDRWASRNGNWIEAYAGGEILQDLSTWEDSDNVILERTGEGELHASSIQSLIIDSTQSTELNLNNSASALTLKQGALLVSSDSVGQTYLKGGQLMQHNVAHNSVKELIVTNLSGEALTLTTNFGSSNTFLSATQNLMFAGKGPIELLGSNWSIGTTNALSVGINGHVKAYSSTALGSYGAVVLGGGHDQATQGAVLELSGERLVIGRLSGGRGGDINYGDFGPGVVAMGAQGHLTLNQGNDSTFAGQITGSGTILKRGGGALTLVNHTSTFNGQLIIAGGTITLGSAVPTLNAVTSILVRGGSLNVLQANTSGSQDHLRNATPVVLQGTVGDGLRLASTVNLAVSETIQGLRLEGGNNLITLASTHSAPTASTTTLSLSGGAGTTTRSEKATLLVRGQNLGSNPASNHAATRLTFSTVSNINNALVGGGGSSAGSRTLSILPYALGETTANSAAASSAVGNSFLTYGAGGVGLRTLSDLEYGQFETAGSLENVNVDQSLSGQSAKTVNSLRILSSTENTTLSGTGKLEITSGALLFAAGSTTNESRLEYDTLTSGAATKELVVWVTSSHANPTSAKAILQTSIIDQGANAVSLTKSGNGTLVLEGHNTYTGETTINAGILEFGTGTAGNLGGGLLRMGGGTLRWGLDNTTDITAGGRTVSLLGGSAYLSPGYGGNVLNLGNVFDVGANEVTLSGLVGHGGYGGLTKTGSGTLRFDQRLNYTGATVIQQGRVDFNGGIAQNSTEALYLVNYLAGKQQIVANVVGDLYTKSVVVGGGYANAGTTSATLTVQNGAVNIVDPSGFVQIGYRDTTAGAGNNEGSLSIADFTLASRVDIRTGQLEVGMYKGTNGSSGVAGELRLSNGENHINAGSIIIGSTPASHANIALISRWIMGSSSNRIETDTMVVGGARSRATASIRANGSFVLRGQQGGNTGANLFIGDNDMIDTNVVTIGTLDLRGASEVDANVNLLILGRIAKSGGAGGGQGLLYFDTGEIRATTIEMADPNYHTPSLVSNWQATQGTLQQLGNATLRYQTLSTVNLTVTTSHGTELSTSVANHDWRGGTLKNMDGRDLRNVNVTVNLNQQGAQNVLDASLRKVEISANRKAIFEAHAELNGIGSFQKMGAGTFELRGTNLNTGNVRVSEGTLALAQSGSMADAAWIEVQASGTFAIRDRENSSYSTDATFSGTGVLDATGGRLSIASGVGAIETHGVLKPGGSSQSVSLASATTVGNQTGTLQVKGSLSLRGASTSVTRAQLQVGSTNRNILASRSTYTTVSEWVDQLATQQPSLLQNAGTNHDLLQISGNLLLQSKGQIEVIATGGYTGAEGDVFNLLDWGTLTANDFVVGARYQTGLETQNDLKLFALSPDLHWDTGLFLSHGALVIVAVPEPQQCLLLGVGLGLLGMRRRRGR